MRAFRTSGWWGTAFCCVMACASVSQAQDEPAATQPVPDEAPPMASLVPDLPDYGGDMWERQFLSGDWGGARTDLARHGIFVQLDLEQSIQGSGNGGAETDNAFRYAGSVDLRLKFDTARMGLWPGGLLELHGESRFGDFLNGKVGSTVNDDGLYPIPGSSDFVLAHATYTQALSENLLVTFGKLDNSTGDENEFAWVYSRDNFMHSSLRWNPVTARTAPYSTLGAGLLIVDEGFSWLLAAFDSEGVPERSGFDTAFEGGTTFATEMRFKWRPFGLEGHQLFGFTYSDALFRSLEQDRRVGLPVDRLGFGRRARRAISSIDSESGSWSAYYNFDQYIYQEVDDPTQGIGVFGRFGISDGEANPIETFYSIGLGGKGLVPGRDEDRMGLGYFYTDWSDTPLTNALGINSSQGVEMYYNIEVTPWMHITPDLQFIVNPGGRVDRDVAVVYGIRMQMSF